MGWTIWECLVCCLYFTFKSHGSQKLPKFRSFYSRSRPRKCATAKSPVSVLTKICDFASPAHERGMSFHRVQRRGKLSCPWPNCKLQNKVNYHEGCNPKEKRFLRNIMQHRFLMEIVISLASPCNEHFLTFGTNFFRNDLHNNCILLLNLLTSS